jgi:4-amino-4-deoxy-L-arabinose transferase-like glycosyltransferase
VAFIHAWLMRHTAVAARDSIGFIRYSLQLESLPVEQVLRESLQHPGYPALIWLISQPVRYFTGTTPLGMQFCAQLVSALASILLVMPLYLLGRELFDRTTGFWGTLLFHCLPVGAHVMADGLSEASYLLFITASLYFGVRALRSPSNWLFALCGIMSGLAYLTRPEGALAAAALGIVLLGMQFYRSTRLPTAQVLKCGLCLIIGFVAVGGPYAWIIGGFTNKPTPNEMMKMAEAKTPPNQLVGQPYAAPPGSTHLLVAVYAPENLKNRLWWGIQAIATEVVRGYQYLPGIPVFFGIIWFRKRLRLIPGGWMVMVLCLLHAAVLWRLAIVVGYVSERHVLLLVMCGCFWGAAAMAMLGKQLSSRLTAAASAWPATLLLMALVAFGLPETFKTLHANRAGHRAAGLWLAEHTLPVDPVVDPFCWAHYYSGRVFWEGKDLPLPPGHHVSQYAIIEQSDHDHIRLPTIAHSQELAARGQAVYWWPENLPREEAKVCVYQVP